MATTKRKDTVNPAAQPRAIAVAVAAAFLPWLVPQAAHAQTPPLAPAPNTLPVLHLKPGGGQGIVHDRQGNLLRIDQITQRMILEGSFSVGADGIVRLYQPGRSAVALINDTSGMGSLIFGKVFAEAQLFVSNTKGVYIAPGARIEAQAFIATALKIADQDFMNGVYKWYREGTAGTVWNQGDIVTPNGYTALMGPDVRNDGVIVARMGSVVLAAGDRVSLDLVGDGLISVSVDQAAFNASVINTGRIEADGGTVLLTARSANALLDTVINNSGTIRANSLVERNGEIILDGGDRGVVSVTGTLQAAGVESGTTGGTIKVLGDKVGLFGNAIVNASGHSGGGMVLIGGNFQGKGPEANASRTYVGSGVRISADAIAEGDGGKVIVWADEVTRFYGTLTARGGSQSGDGGFGEISGKGSLDFEGKVDLSAPGGAAGTVLFDPLNITISTNAAAATGGFVVGGDQVEAFADDTGTSNFDVTAGTGSFAGVATGTLIELQAEDDITLQTNFNLDTSTGNTGVHLTLRAGDNVDLGSGFTITSSGGNISVTANDASATTPSGTGSILGNANIVTTGVTGGSAGSVTLSTAGSSTGTISVGNITAVGGNEGTNTVGGNGGAVSLTAADGNITTGTIQTSGGNAGVADAGGQFAGGNAGSVSLQVTGATAPRAIAVGAITSTGGTGSSATILDGAGGAGGLGGGTTVTATVGSGASLSASSITTTGGTGGASLGPNTAGVGGNGGGVIATVSQAATISGTITTSGGTGGNSTGATGTAGNGGNAAPAAVTSTTANVSVAGITATGGAAGAQNGGAAGTAGAAASATISAATNILLNANINVGSSSVTFNFGQGGTGGVLTIPGASITAGTVSATGGAGNDTFNIGSWGAAGTANGAAGDDTFNINTSLTADLIAGANADSFVFVDGAVLTGTIDGGGGTDTVNLSAYTTALTVNLNAVGATDGATGTTAGTTNPVSAGFSNIDVFTGGNGGNTFNVNAAVTANLTGGTGADTFNVANALTGTVAGGAGADTLQGTALSNATLAASSAANGFDGSITGVSGGFTGVNTLNGSGSLTGENVASTWTTSGANAGTYNDGTATLAHSGFSTWTGGNNNDTFNLGHSVATVNGSDGTNTFNVTAAITSNLTGGTGADSFVLSGGGTLTGAVNGGGGTNTLTGDNVNNVWTITALDSGTLTGITGGWSDIQNLVGGTSTDTFTLTTGTLTGSINGSAGTDTLTAANVANTWTINGGNSGTLTGVGSGWSNIENLVGGTGTDSFSGVAGSVAGTISDGGGGATTLSGTIISGGSQTYSAAVSSAGVTLNAGTAAISATNAGNNFSGTLNVAGSSASIADLNELTIGANLTGGLTTNSGALTYLNGTSVGSLNSTASGAVDQTGAITVSGATSINAGGNAITLTSANNFQGPVSLVGGTTQITDANALTLGNVNVGALTTINTGALDLGTLNATSLTATTNGGNITQSGPANVTGATNLQAGTGSIMLALANDFGGVVAASGIGITLNDVNTLTPGTINAGSGSVNLSANSLGAGGTVSAGSASSFSSNTNVSGLDINMPNVPLALSGAATQWSLKSTPTTIAQPNPVTVPSSNVGVTYNLASIIASVAQQQAASASSSVSASVAAVIVDEANKTFGTDSVAEAVEYGFAGEVGATPPMDHRIDESGISLPRCVQESREGVPCK